MRPRLARIRPQTPARGAEEDPGNRASRSRRPDPTGFPAALLAVVLGLVCGRPVRADQSFARYDLALTRHVNVLSDLISGSGKTFADWCKGRLDTPAARARLLRADQQAAAEEKALLAMPVPTGLGALNASARQYAHSQVQVVSGALGLIRAGSPDPQSLRRFVDSSLVGGRLAQRRWFLARQNVLPLAQRAPLSAPLASLYRWEGGWQPLWAEQGELSTQIEHLVADYSRDNSQTSAEQIHQVIQRTLALNEQGSRIASDASTRQLQQAAIQEMAAMGRVAEAAEGLMDDPSNDSVSRLHRAVDAASERSAEVQRLTLKLLQSGSTR